MALTLNDIRGLTRVAIYLRKSRADIEAEERGEGDTLARHRRALLELAKKYSLNVVAIYEEIMSGDRIIDRPEVQRLLHAVREGQYEAVMVMDLDRLGRGNKMDQGLIQDAFQSSGTLIITPRKVYDLNDELDEDWSDFELFLARHELKIIKRRLQRGRRLSVAQQGRHIAAKPPYGYRRDENLKLHPDPETAPIVRQIFEWVAEGLGRRRVARRLNEMGIPAPRGGIWEETAISHIVKNEVYLGHIIWGKRRWRKTAEGRYKNTRNPRESWIVYENAHEPLVTEDLWKRANEALHRRFRDPGNPNARLSNPLAGLVVCGYCGKVLIQSTKRNRKHPRLYCKTIGCPQRTVALHLVEQRILQVLEQIVAHEAQESVAQALEEKHEDNGRLVMLERQIAELERELETLNKQKGNLHDLLEQGVYDVQTYLERNQVLAERIEATQERLERFRQEYEDEQQRYKQRHEIVPRIRSVLEAYHQGNAEEKNRLLKSVIEKAVFKRTPEMKRMDEFELDVFLRI